MEIALSPVDPSAGRLALLDAVAQITGTLAASSNESEKQATLAMSAVAMLAMAGVVYRWYMGA